MVKKDCLDNGDLIDSEIKQIEYREERIRILRDTAIFLAIKDSAVKVVQVFHDRQLLLKNDYDKIVSDIRGWNDYQLDSFFASHHTR